MLMMLAVASILLAQAAPAPAASSPTATAAAKPEAPKKPKLICDTEKEVGSFIAKKVCRTPEQIEAERVKSRAWDQGIQDRQAACRNAANC